MNVRTVRRRFRSPSSLHAPWVGWAWNGPLDDSRLLEQADALVQGGFGGAAIYPHDGIEQELHTSPAWFEHLAVVSRRLRRKGVSLHVRESLEGSFAAVEEDICRDHPEACLNELTAEEVVVGERGASGVFPLRPSHFHEPGEPVAVFVVTRESPSPAHRAAGARPVEASAAVPLIWSCPEADLSGKRLLIFRRRSIPNRLNYFDRHAAELFLDTVPRQLNSHAKRYLGNPLTGLFIDGIGLRLTPGALPWDPEIETLFRETRGYSLIDSLPALFYDFDECERVRYDYWTIITDMLREGLVTPIRQWCEARRLRFGISLRPLDRPDPALLETALLPVERSSDDFVIRIPYDAADKGYDNPFSLGDWLVAIKQVCSICEQYGGVRRAAVTIGCETPMLDLERAAALGKWLYALGAHTVIFERIAYEPDFPGGEDRISLNGEEPYWPALKTLNETLGRIGGLMTQGRAHCSVAVLYPSASVQALHAHPLHATDWNGDANREAPAPERLLLTQTARLAATLHEAGIDYHFVQERTLIESGAAHRHELVVGEQSYRILLVPPCVNLRGQTLDVLADFAMSGGTIGFAGSVPYLLDGRPSKYLEKFIVEYGTVLANRSDLFDYRPIVEYLHARPGFSGAVGGEEGLQKRRLLIHRRDDEDVEIYYAFNPSPEPVQLTVHLQTQIEGHIEEWEPQTGNMLGSVPCDGEDTVHIEGHWQGYEAKIFMAIPTAHRESPAENGYEPVQIDPPEWAVARTQLNAAILTGCTIFETPEPGALRTLAEARGLLRNRLSEEGHPLRWTTHWNFEISPGRPLESECILLAPEPPPGEGTDAEPARVYLNGDLLEEGEERRFGGRFWQGYACKNLGSETNSIEMLATYSREGDFVPPVLLGEFDVVSSTPENTRIQASDPPVVFGGGNTVHPPAYRGEVTYTGTWTLPDSIKDFRVTLAAPGMRGNAQVRVNENAVGTLLWRPYEIDITKWCKKGSNTVEIAVAGPPGAALDSGHGEGMTNTPAPGLPSAPTIRVEVPALPAKEEAAEPAAEDRKED